MVLNYKIDRYDQIWFVCCSSIRTSEGDENKVEPLNLNDDMILKDANSKIVVSPSELNRL